MLWLAVLTLLRGSTAAALTKEYTYRAQKNNVDLSAPCASLKYGFANLTVAWSSGGECTGVITGFVNETTSGEKWVLNVTGTWRAAPQVQRQAVAFDWTAEGPVDGLEWGYAYTGVALAPWFAYSAPSQQQWTLVGSVVRLVGHGAAPAGEAASFYAVEKED